MRFSKKLNLQIDKKVKIARPSVKRKDKVLMRRKKKVSSKSLWMVLSTVMFAIIAICAIFYSYGWRIGNEIVVNGKTIGITTSRTVFNEILTDVKSLAKAATGGQEQELSYTLRPILIKQASVTSDFAIKQNMLAQCEKMTQAYAIYINEVLVSAAATEEEAFAALDEVRNQYNRPYLQYVEFLDSVVVRYEYVPEVQVTDKIQIVLLLNGEVTHKEIYTVKTDEEFANIAQRFGMSLEDLSILNPNVTDEIIKSGEKINVETTQTTLRVQVKTQETYDKVLLYETIETEDPTIEQGKTKVESKGKTGKSKVTAIITWLNGYEQGREPISEEVITEPIAEKVRVGTKEVIGGVVNTASTGFMWPAIAPVTSQMGERWGRAHEGIDIGASYGAAIRAAIGGTVTLAAWSGDYGNCIRINSGDGLVEIYGHASEILVTEGQEVVTGELIGRVGSTGRSTGPHLHFEIRKNGVPTNPLNYLPKQ